MLVTYKTAKLAFDKGVIIPSENCFPLNGEAGLKDGSKFMDFIPRPHQHELQKVLREVYHIYVWLEPIGSGWRFWLRNKTHNSNNLCDKTFNSYEQTLEEGLLQALKIINP